MLFSTVRVKTLEDRVSALEKENEKLKIHEVRIESILKALDKNFRIKLS